jgi:hypothetical protein
MKSGLPKSRALDCMRPIQRGLERSGTRMVVPTAIALPSQSEVAQFEQIQGANSEQVQAGSTPPRRWIYGPVRDCLLIHGGAGLIALPIAVASFAAPQALPGFLFAYTLLLGLPHVTATHVRLHLDEDCHQRHRWLAIVAPLAVAALVATIVYSLKMLPVLVLAWFLLQNWHAGRQNFGIMRRYIRMAGSEPTKPVNRLAEAGIEILPWAAVATTLLIPNKTYFGYPIAMLPGDYLFPVWIALWAVTAVIVVAYIALECEEYFRGRTVPGRILCFVSGAVVNITAWVIVGDIVWGYLVVSAWHALQYISYVHSFRATPPPGAKVLKMSWKPHVGLLFAGGIAFFLVGLGLQWWLPPAIVIFHLAMNFHHYLADGFIWRVPKVSARPQ